MSEENVEVFKRGLEAYNRRDLDAMLEMVDPEVEFHAVLQVALGGEAVVYRGYDGARDMVRDLDDTLAPLHIEISEIRDLDDVLVATGSLRGRGTESGVDIESPYGLVVEFRNGKAIRIRDYLDPKQALEAAGLSE
jgi:ketosteroid isomerase-like protein